MNRINSSIHEARTIFNPVQSSTPSSLSTSLVLPSNINIEEGFAVPKRNNFRFSRRQKAVLLKMFLDGEASNNKMSAEQAVHNIRTMKKLKIYEYMKVSQVKLLFSR